MKKPLGCFPLTQLAVALLAVLFHLQLSGEESREALPEDVREALLTRDAQLGEAKASHEQKTADLYDKYAAALERELTKHQTNGDLESAVAVTREIESAKKNREISAETSLVLIGLRATLAEAVGGIQAETQRAIALADVACLRQLQAARTMLTQAGDLQTALLVDAEIKAVKNGDAPAVADKTEQTLPMSEVTNAVSKLVALDTEQPIEGEHVLQPGAYRLKDVVTVGRREKTGAGSTPHKGHLLLPQGVKIEGGGIFSWVGTLNATSTLLRRVAVTADMHGSVAMNGSILDHCTTAKGGSLFTGAFSSKWSFTNCVISGSFMRRLSLRFEGYKLVNCTFINVDFPQVTFIKDAAKELRMEWFRIEQCRFINCTVPEGVFMASNDCIFENCKFPQSSEPIPCESPVRAILYLTPVQEVKPSQPNFEVQVLDARFATEKAGSSVLYKRDGNNLKF